MKQPSSSARALAAGAGALLPLLLLLLGAPPSALGDGHGCQDALAQLPGCQVGNCWGPLGANSSFTDQTMLPTLNNASAFFAESGGTVFFGGGGLQNATATLCVPYSDDAWEAFCQSQWSLDCASAIAVDPMTFAKVADYGCNIDVERPEGSWFEQDGDTITGACNNATVLASIEGCQGKFSIADTVLLPPYMCGAPDPDGLTTVADDLPICENCTTAWQNLWAQET